MKYQQMLRTEKSLYANITLPIVSFPRIYRRIPSNWGNNTIMTHWYLFKWKRFDVSNPWPKMIYIWCKEFQVQFNKCSFLFLMKHNIFYIYFYFCCIILIWPFKQSFQDGTFSIKLILNNDFLFGMKQIFPHFFNNNNLYCSKKFLSMNN